MTPIQLLGREENNTLYVKREDFIPFSFGGNKARKAELFFREIDEKGCGAVVTYGSASSNHCRVVANQCRRRGLPCWIISPDEGGEQTFNSRMTELFGARRITVPLDRVHDTIEDKLAELRQAGANPYFIEGGGHGPIGTEAYVQCYREITAQEKDMGLRFDYIFFASGTGTTQAGLVCGQIMARDADRRIIGISIARKNPRGRGVVLDSIRTYLGGEVPEEEIQARTVFVDAYTSGYGRRDGAIAETIGDALSRYGLPLDATYTGKAFWGMREYIRQQKIAEKNILFIHTGGTPLFFDFLRDEVEP